MDFLRRLRRPGATVTAVLVVALAAVNVAKGTDWPAGWWDDRPGEVIFVALSIVTGLGSLFVALGFRSVLGKQSQKLKLETAAQSVARLIQQETKLKHDEIGVNIWLIKGMVGFRRLVRAAIVVAQPRHQTPITWTKGKGIIGEAWARKKSRFADLERVRELYPTEQLWCGLKRDDRFRLSWAEFEETARYHAVLAVPLRRHRFSRHPVRGVVAIDVLVKRKGGAIDGIQRTKEFSSIIRTCEAALAGEE